MLGSWLKMPTAGPARRIVAMIGVVVVLLAIAIGVTLWRYGVADSKYRDALHKGQTIVFVEHATDKLVDVSTTVNTLAIGKATDQLARLQQIRGEFEPTIDEASKIAPSAAKNTLIAQVRAGGQALFAQAERGVVPVAGTPKAPAAVNAYNELLGQLETPLDGLREAAKAESARAQASASGASSDASTIALITGLLAGFAAVLAALYTARVISGQFEQIDGQVEHIHRQVAHIERIRDTAGKLAEAATDMRSAAAESASATSQQSAGIAEAASTIEELDATAAVIADNARAGTTAVERTGDTMRDMQEQVEAISQRSLSLGERSQKIGEVLELINGIAEQTNLLALNAAIEAARAGEAGRGFAVVASEVKALAEQTAKATGEISQQINGIQAATDESVGAIREIGQTISRMSEIASAIAAAVEEQGAATQEISRNVQRAAQGTQQVSANIVDVERSATQTGSSSSQVLSAAKSLSSESSRLQLTVDKFLSSVRAA
jgi:methyl-accepting chemotaxis protein